MKEASFYTVKKDKVQCHLCPHNCLIAIGKKGICKVRRNENRQLIAESYGKICSMHFDPIEKKPLYHYFPGSAIFSVGSVGCNLQCRWCQNCEISQSGVSEYPYLKDYLPDQLVRLAADRKDNIGIAYTYNEPTVWFEYMYDIAGLASDRGLKNVMVTNGFINQEPLEMLIPFMDAFSVDLKGFNENFYRKFTSSQLKPVLESLKTIKKHDRHLEITNLVVTDTNDDEKEFASMVEWIAGELGKATVLHISRYFPMYKMTKEPTSALKLQTLYDIANEKLDFVYLGNTRGNEGQNTFCPNCKTLVIERIGYDTRIVGLDREGRCRHCDDQILSTSCI